MWKQLFELLQGAVFLGRDVVQLRREVEQLRKEMNDVHLALNQIAHSFEHLSEREKLERGKWVLQLENSLLRIERRLPSGKPPKSRESGP